MLQESLLSIWASMYSWFTPTVLFVLLNLMIGTIAITSGLGFQKHKDDDQQTKQPTQILNRAPSLLQRLKSIDLSRYRSEALIPPASDHVLLPNEASEEEEVQEEEEQEQEQEIHYPVDDQNTVAVQDHRVTRSKSDSKPTSGDKPVTLAKKMMKSASSNSAFGHFKEEEIEERRPSTVKEGKKNASDLIAFGDDEEVDAKADDFINRFKQQLKLQRLESLIRYKEMISRGAATAK